MTNRERLRQMTDEELAEFIARRTDCDYCDFPCEGTYMVDCIKKHYDWLKAEAEGKKNEI